MKNQVKSGKAPQSYWPNLNNVHDLKTEIERSRYAIDIARNHFDQEVDPTLIDCYIYELNAAQLRYQFLLRTFKSREK